MRWKRFLLLVILVLTLSSLSLFVLADSTISVTPVHNQIKIGEEGSFKLSVTNNEAQRQRYTIYSFQSGQGWSVDPYPLKDKIIDLASGQTYTTTIKVRAYESFLPGIYYVSIAIESDLGERRSESLKVYLSPEHPIDYVPSIRATLDINEKINPGKPVSVKLFLENKNPLNLEDLKIRIESDMPEFSKEVSVTLPPLEKKTVEFAITPNPYQQPKMYTLFFVFDRDGQTVKVIDKKIEIIPLLPEFEVVAREDKAFLRKIVMLRIRNTGNVLNEQEVKYPVSFLDGLLSRSAGSDVDTRNDQRYLVWEMLLGPNETREIQYIVDHRLLLYLFLALAVFSSFYFYVKSPIVITKKALTARGTEEGALSEIKVTLEVRNTSRKPIHHVTVTDVVPPIANVGRSLELGTLKPKEMRHTKKGTVVIWGIAELDAQEHRLITYNIKAKLNILGMFSLPRAAVEFVSGRRKGKAYSNIFRLGKE